jgi:hypothetical protein
MRNSRSQAEREMLRKLYLSLESGSGGQLGSYWRRNGASDDELDRLYDYVRSFGNGNYEADAWKIAEAIAGENADRDDVEFFWERWGCNPDPSEPFIEAFVEAALYEDHVIDD